MRINFKEMKFFSGITRRDVFVYDIREQFADIMYRMSNGIASLELARKIYNSEGEEEYNEKELDLIKQTVSICSPQLIDAFNELMKGEDDYVINGKSR